ncbi:hypothetical protein AB6A40_004555 [Gnathostoma spinigerum]|uniref:Uncharacterized protein n=1 Tax=Gnathostoma spinigerum TaxID=75299 RepID=A0ABD6EK97_9BILA
MKRIIIWRTGEPEDDRVAGTNIVRLKKDPLKLIQINAPEGQVIRCSAINGDGSFLCFSTSACTYIYALAPLSESSPSVHNMHTYPTASTALKIINTTVFIATGGFRILKANLMPSVEIEPLEIISNDDAGEIILWNTNESNSLFVALTTRNEIYLLRICDETVQKMEFPPLGVFMNVQFLDDGTSLLVLCANLSHLLIEFSISKNCVCGESFSSSKLQLRDREYIVDMDIGRDDIALISSEGSLYIMKRNQRVLMAVGDMSNIWRAHQSNRCAAARWLSTQRLLLNIPSSSVEPLQAAFRAKRFAQN